MQVSFTLEALLLIATAVCVTVYCFKRRRSVRIKTLDNIIQACLDGILVVDKERSVVHYNSSFANMWNIAAQEPSESDGRSLLRHAMEQLVDPDAYVAGMEQAFASDGARWADLVFLKDGRIFERRSQPLVKHDAIEGRVFSFRDITERCRAEESLKAKLRQSEVLSRLSFLTLEKGPISVLLETFKSEISRAIAADRCAVRYLGQDHQVDLDSESPNGSAHFCKVLMDEAGGTYLLSVVKKASQVFTDDEAAFLQSTIQILNAALRRHGKESADKVKAEPAPATSPLAVAATPIPDQIGSGQQASQHEDGPLQLLVVEDNPINQKVLVQLLKRANHRVDVASDGLQAVEMAATTAYDLILMDCQMPRMDGLDATRAIRKDGLNRQTNIVAVTANAFPEDRTRCLDAGMNDHVTKPVTKARLDETLRRWMPAERQK